jgi:HEPN domain-containing protein
MMIFDLFSKRQKRLRGEVPEVYVYDDIPTALRIQIVHIWRDALGDLKKYDTPVEGAYKLVHDTLCREYGLFALASGREASERLIEFLLSEKNTERVLDAVELSFRYVERVASDNGYRYRASPSMTPKGAVAELNARFLEHGVGFEYHDGELIRKDSEFVHSEVVKPALEVLRGKLYSGANEEFRKAYEHYRHKRYKECQNECLKALESTLKAICTYKKWPFKTTDTAKALLEICFRQELVPQYLQSEFSALRSTLESGVPTIRNKTSGHGQGTSPVEVPSYLASYMLHLTATTVLFLAQAAESPSS